MKIFLINPPDDLGAFLGKGRTFVPTFEPLGLLYISAVCKRQGYNVEVIDAFAERLTLQELKNTILKACPDVIGFTSFVSNGNVIYELGKWIKKEIPETIVIFGNVHASVYAKEYLENACCDVVVHGEGEYVFLKILECIENNDAFSRVDSISYLEGGKFITTSKPGVIEDLSLLPFPDRDGVKQHLYNIPAFSNIPYRKKKHGIGKHMFTSRGCLFSCSFCVVHNKKGLRCNSVINAVDEMVLLHKRYSADYIFFMDPIFISNKKRVIEICREIKRRDLRFNWGCEGHVKFVDKEMILEMESAGCNDVAFGIESGVQRILDQVQKGTHLEEIEKSINLIKNNTKIKISGLFILGLPTETYKDSIETINYAKMLPLDMAQFSVFVPYPGSPLFFQLQEKGEIDTGVRKDGSLDTNVWLRYSAYIFYTKNKPIWITPDLDAARLKKLHKKAFRDFYFRPKQFYFQLQRLSLSRIWDIILAFKDTFF